MKKPVLAVLGVCVLVLGCDKKPDINAKGELKMTPTPAQAAAAPTGIIGEDGMKNPASITNGADIKNPASQKVLIGNIKGENPGAQKLAPNAPTLTNGQKGIAR
jgi:hypothetical protein